jgi:hypothetical protein
MKYAGVLLAIVLMGQQLPAQLADGENGAADTNEVASYAPLPLFITGAGKVVPFEDGQTLEVGRRYHMNAIPDRGFVFSNWVPVDVFYSTFTYTNGNLGPTTVTAYVVSPEPVSFDQHVLEFTMQPEVVLFGGVGPLFITSSKGWQANFVPEENPDSLKHLRKEDDCK